MTLIKCNRHDTKFLGTLFIRALFCASIANASLQPRSLFSDNRIKVVSYHKNNVISIHGSVFIATQISFSTDEIIENIESGDLDAWSVHVAKNHPNIFFIKPTIVGSNTNMTVMTNKHTYYFHLLSNRNTKVGLCITYGLHFIYPADQARLVSAKAREKVRVKSSILSPSLPANRYNWDYSYHGCKSIMPIHVFDNGSFTYMQFRKNTPFPAIFSIHDRSGRESLVNYRVAGSYIIVKQVSPQFTLRQGPDHVASIFNSRLIKILTARGE